MSARSTKRSGFTLIEVMLVVAIIGVLASLAVPQLILFQLRAKSAEAKTNLSALRTAEHGYFSEHGRYVPAGISPAGTLGSSRNPWLGGGVAQFAAVGWAPAADPFFQYAVSVPAAAPFEFTATAVGDLDADGQTSQYAYVHPIPGATSGPPPAQGSCSPMGVYNPGSGAADLVETIGACSRLDGRGRF